MRRIIWCLCLIGLMGWAGISSAFADVPGDISVPDEQRHAVAFFPSTIPVYLYKNVTPQAEIDPALLRKALIEQAENNPYLRVLSSAEIEAGFNQTELRQANSYMQAEIEMGYARSFMENMDYPSAVDAIRRAAENYQKSFAQYYRPQDVAQAWQLLAYALIAQATAGEIDDDEQILPARLAFAELIRLAPSLTMLEGRQSPERVRTYDEALDLFLGDILYRQTPKKDADAIAQMLGVGVIVFPRIVGDRKGRLFLEMDVYQTGNIAYLRKELDFPDNNGDAYVANVASSMLSNVYDCIPTERPAEKIRFRSKERRFAIEVGGSVSSHMVHPTEAFLLNVGGHLSLSYMFDDHFFMRVQMEGLTVLQDSAHELYKNFQIYQFPVLIGISNDWKWARVFLALGPNFSFSTDYTILRTTTCKTFGIDDVECGKEDAVNNREPFAMLIDFVVGASFGLDPFYVSFEIESSVTIWPFEARFFKHMLGARLGIQYWF